MIQQPAHNFISAVHFMARRDIWAVDHQYLDVKVPGRINLRARPAAARILGNDKINAVLTQKRKIVFVRKRASGDNRMMVGKGQRFGWLINQSQQIKVLWIVGELGQVHTTDSQKNALWRAGQLRRRIGNIHSSRPAVIFRWHPWCARQCDQRSSGFRTRPNRVATHLRGKGMGGVDHMSNLVFTDKSRQSIGSAKSTNARRQRLGFQRLDPSSEGHNGLNTGLGQFARQGTGFDRAPKQQEVLDHV